MKEKSLLKPETTRNTEISGPPCTFLICVVTSRVNDLKYVLFFFLFCFVFFVCNNIAYALAVLIVKKFIRVFFFFLE